MKYPLVIILAISFNSFGQTSSEPDSLKEIPVNQMVTFFKKLESQNLPINKQTDLQFAAIKKFIGQNPKSPYSANFISWGKYFDSSRIDLLYTLLDSSLRPGIKESIHYQKIRSVLVPGSPFPNLFPTDSLNQPFNISNLNGKVVFVDVWASWCIPCRAEMSHLIELYNRYKNSGFIVIAISLDDNKDKWLAAIAKDQQPWIQLSELKSWRSNPMLTRWGIGGIPYNFLIDREGKLFDKAIDFEFLEKKIQQVL